MNNKLLFPDFENIIVAGEIPTAIEDGYSYLEQVMALRKYVLSLGEYTKDLTDEVNNNTSEITNLKAFKHITHLGTETNNVFKLEELNDDLYYADTRISIEYKKGFLVSYEKGSLITKTSETIDKPETGVVHRIMGYGNNIFAFAYSVVVNGEITDSDVSIGSLTEILTKINKNVNDINDLTTKINTNTNAIASINNILDNTSQIENLTESANLWNLNNGIYKATKNLEITISSDESVSKEPISTGQIIMIQSSNNDEWEMWLTVETNIMYAQTYLEDGVYTGSRQSINVRTLTSKVESLETRVTNLEQAPKDESIFIQFNEGTDTIIPKLQVFIDNFRKGIVTPIYWYYTSGDLFQLSKIVNGLDNTAGRRMNLYFTAFDSTTLTNKQIPVGNMLLNVDLSSYNITNITKNWEYQTIESGSTELPVASSTTLGGVKIGDGIDVTEEGVISANTNIAISSRPTKNEIKKIYDAYISGKNYNIYNLYNKFEDGGYSIANIRVRDKILYVTFIKNSGKYAYVLDYTYNSETDTITSETNNNFSYVTGDSNAFTVKKIMSDTGTFIDPNLALSKINPATYKNLVYNFLYNILKYSKYYYGRYSDGNTLLVSNYNIVDYDNNTTTAQIYKLISVNGEFIQNGSYWDLTDVFVFINKDLSYKSETKDKYNVIEYKMKSAKPVGKHTANIFMLSIFTENSEITLNQYDYYVDKTETSTNISNSKKFSFDFLFSDDTTDSVSSYNSSSFIITGISKSFDVNEIYGELMVKYSEVVSGITYSSVCPADRLKYMLTNVSDVDYSFRTLSDGTSQLTLFIRRTDETQAFTSPSGLKIENIFINGYFLNSTEDVSKSTTIEKN